MDKLVVLSESYQRQKPEVSIKAYCSYCWTDRIITTNGKCRVCGSRLVIPRHWESTARKLELIARNRGSFFPLEIKKTLYIVPYSYLERFTQISHDDLQSMAVLIEEIKDKCKPFKI